MTSPTGPTRPTRFAVVGSGWRAGFFVRASRALPDRLRISGVVTRSPERGLEVERAWGVPTARDLAALVARERPDVVVVSVPWDAAPDVTRAAVELGLPVLTETPPAPDEDSLRALYRDVGGSGLVQVAEQYMLMPSHAARWEVVRRGAIGTPTSVQVSSTHQYHAVSMIRSLLGVGFGDVVVRAQRFEAPLVDPMTRDGWTGTQTEAPATTTVATLDFGAGRSAVYDFTDNQWHNPLRSNRIVVRGTHGELVDDRVVRLVDARTVVESPLVRRQTGIDLNLEGFDLDHISWNGDVVYRNPYAGARLAEDDISVVTILEQTARWCRGDGPAPYPLAEASQDHLVALAIERSARTGEAVATSREPWAG